MEGHESQGHQSSIDGGQATWIPTAAVPPSGFGPGDGLYNNPNNNQDMTSTWYTETVDTMCSSAKRRKMEGGDNVEVTNNLGNLQVVEKGGVHGGEGLDFDGATTPGHTSCSGGDPSVIESPAHYCDSTMAKSPVGPAETTAEMMKMTSSSSPSANIDSGAAPADAEEHHDGDGGGAKR
eukprot:Platyproteum_vivax@DN10075_c0_g1_i1.p1